MSEICLVFQILEENEKSAHGGVIFLISSGGTLKTDDMDKLRHLVVDKQVQVVPVIYPVTPRSPTNNGGIDQLATMSGKIPVRMNI